MRRVTRTTRVGARDERRKKKQREGKKKKKESTRDKRERKTNKIINANANARLL